MDISSGKHAYLSGATAPRPALSLGGLSLSSALKQETFRAFDADGDGALSAAEFAEVGKNGPASDADRAAIFSGLDRNGDGRLRLNEVGASKLFKLENLQALLGLQEGGLADWLAARADADGDGALSAEEYAKVAPPPMTAFRYLEGQEQADAGEVPAEQAQRAFAGIDKDGDGRLSLEELTDDLEGAPELLSLGGGYSRVSGAMVRLSDRDGDGALSAEEIASAARAAGLSGDAAVQLAERADKDGDGRVTTAELDATTATRAEFYDSSLFRMDERPAAAELLLARLLRSTLDRLSEQLTAPAGPRMDASA